MTKDHYATLGVSRVADSSTIHSAFRALARQYHPDAGSGSSPSKFREALEAYHTLSDPARRRQHDIDLGECPRPKQVMAEPLFDPARAGHSFAPQTRSLFDQLIEEPSSSVESVFEFVFFSRMFF